MALAFTQLRLFKIVAEDVKLPWQRPQERQRMTPSRGSRGFTELLPVLRAPASMPKSCGMSTGQPKSGLSGRATRVPARPRLTSTAKHLDGLPVEQQQVTLPD